MKLEHYLAIAVAIIIGVAVYLRPNTMDVVEEAPVTTMAEEVIEVELSALESKVSEAVEIIQNAEGAPMRGVMMLKEVLEEDPNNEQALFWLGEFSMVSGQWEKALGRFQTLNELFPEVENYAYNKCRALIQLGDTTGAVAFAVEYVQNHPEALRIKEIQDLYQN